MRITSALLLAMVASLGSTSVAAASDWLTLPSHYTHDPISGQRVSQYAPPPSPTAPLAADYRTSGFSHTRSSLNYGQSADNYYRVNSWGAPVQPYGEWRFPNRPYSAPYSQWGAPYAGLGQNYLGIFGGNFGGPTGAGVPGGTLDPSGQGNYGFPGNQGYPNGFPGNNLPGYNNPLNPYPIGPNSAYPDHPYYDGYHPVYRD